LHQDLSRGSCRSQASVFMRALAAASPSFLLFSIRQFSAFAEHQRLFQRIFVGILDGLRTFSVLAEVASGPRR